MYHNLFSFHFFEFFLYISNQIKILRDLQVLALNQLVNFLYTSIQIIVDDQILIMIHDLGFFRSTAHTVHDLSDGV